MSLVKYPCCEGTELKVYDMSGNVIGFVVMGGIAVVVAACSFIRAKAKKTIVDAKLVNHFKNATGCSMKDAIIATRIFHEIIDEMVASGTVPTDEEMSAVMECVYLGLFTKMAQEANN